MMTSIFQKHTNCPSCGSHDNLAIFTDHEFCFGCSYLLFYNYHKRYINDVKKTDVPTVSLPHDIEAVIPVIAENWLKKYDLTTTELLNNQVVWSEFRQLLVFPYFDDQHFLWGWQGRYFGSDPKHPKWVGKGNFKGRIKVYHPTLTSTKEPVIIIVEDIISCIKISRQYHCICLHGSFIDNNKMCIINNLYKPKEIIIWLDRDKRKESYEYSVQLNNLGIKTRVISTNLDPKEYNNNQIKEIINE